jgi:capsular polysaccharide biosynthesis protein
MELTHYIRALRQFRALVVVGGALGVAAAAAIAWSQTPTYASSAQLFASTHDTQTGLLQAYEGAVLARRRMLSYAEIVKGPAVAQAVARTRGLTDDGKRLRRRIDASVPLDTVLLDITVTDASPQGARRLAEAVAVESAALMNRLEKTTGRPAGRVHVSVLRHASRPGSPVAPRKPAALALGALLGFAAGAAAAVARARRRPAAARLGHSGPPGARAAARGEA